MAERSIETIAIEVDEFDPYRGPRPIDWEKLVMKGWDTVRELGALLAGVKDTNKRKMLVIYLEKAKKNRDYCIDRNQPI